MDIEFIISNYFSQSNQTQATFKNWLSCIIEESLSYLRNKDNHSLQGKVSPQDLSKLFHEQDIPQLGEDVEKVLKQIFGDIVQNSVRLSQPSYIGHMTQSCPNFALLCDYIIGFLNQNVVKIETALSATYIEWETICWFHKLIYNEKGRFYSQILDSSQFSLGNTCSGGTVANLTALIVARNHAFPNLQKIGLYQAYCQADCVSAVVLVSRRGHYSIKKAAAICGIGEENVIEIPCEPFTNQIDIDELIKTIDILTAKKVKIIALIGIAGSTETGSIDNLLSLARIAQEHRIWFHVDAAWGGALLLSSKHKSLLAGIEFADSVSIDGHKFLYLTLSHSLVLFKNKSSLNTIRHSANYIIRKGSVDLGRTSIEGSRRFDSFKLWFSFKIMGKMGYESLINSALEKGRLFYKLIEQQEDFEITSAYYSCILTYRFIPQKMKLILEVEKNNKKNSKKITKINSNLNKINIEIQKKQRANGKNFVSRTILESFMQGQEIVVLRALPFNPLTNASILAEILAEQSEFGRLMTNN